MTEEELARERAEAAQLIAQINWTMAELDRMNAVNAALSADLNVALQNVWALTENAQQVANQVESAMGTLAKEVVETSVSTKDVFAAIKELTEDYVTYKNLSEASKNLTQYNDEYSTRFSYYTELRRITLGYVIGLDMNIISDESLRKKVEKAYLQNTEYWLAYCIMAVMLWKSDEREAAERALNKSLNMDYFSACLFYLLINLRFGRIETAKKWYLCYLESSDMGNLGSEWQYLLQAYLLGAFGSDEAFERMVAERFKSMLNQVEITTVGFANRFSDKSCRFAQTFLHRTEEAFPLLRRYCKQYEKLMELLSTAEKNPKLAQYYNSIAEAENTDARDLPQRIENVLYSLINEYEAQEKKVVCKIKENEAIIDAQGDLTAARNNVAFMLGEKETKNLGDLMLDWAFAGEESQTDLTVKRFAISYMKEPIQKGLSRYVEGYREEEPSECCFDIDGCMIECGEDGFDENLPKIEEYYRKSRLKTTMADKQVKIYSCVCIAAVVLLLILFAYFSPEILTLGILAGLVGSFLLWRRIVDVGRLIESKKQDSIMLFRRVLAEFRRWRELFKAEDAKSDDMLATLDRF